LRKFKTPIQDFLATVLVFKLNIYSRDSLVAFDSYQSEKVRNTRIVNLTEPNNCSREPNSYNHLGAFYVTCFARMCEIFTDVVSEFQRGPHVVL